MLLDLGAQIRITDAHVTEALCAGEAASVASFDSAPCIFCILLREFRESGSSWLQQHSEPDGGSSVHRGRERDEDTARATLETRML